MSSTRVRLLRAARDLVATAGPAVSMAQVAESAGVSRQALYLHFPSRAALLVAVVRDMDDESRIRERCEQALALPDPIAAYRAFLDEWLEYAGRIQPLASALIASRHQDAAASAAWEDRMRVLHGGFLVASRRLGDAGRLRAGLDAARAADLAWALASVAVVEQLCLDRRWNATTMQAELREAVLVAVTG